MNYWRIGCKEYFREDMLDVFSRFPFVWGGAVGGRHGEGSPYKGKLYVKNLKDVNVGDIIVAGGVKNIDYIGKITQKPTFIPSEKNYKATAYYQSYGIEEETDAATLTDFGSLRLHDVVCMKAKWYKIGANLKLPYRQPPGGFQSLRRGNKLFVLEEIVKNN